MPYHRDDPKNVEFHARCDRMLFVVVVASVALAVLLMFAGE